MILDIEPVTNVGAVAIDAQRQFIERVEDGERDQLLRKMKRTIVVRAVGYDDGQPERSVPGSDQMIRSRLRSGIRGRRRVRGLFGEERVVERQVAENFIRRNMMEAERSR